MYCCTFFGHREIPQEIKSSLYNVLIDLIERKQVTCFLVGNHGQFDAMVTTILKQLCVQYPHVSYQVVLAYLPTHAQSHPTVYPEGLESVPAKVAIIKRNEWMIEHCDYVVAYVYRNGGAAKFEELSRKKGKVVINLANLAQ